ncbi:MAG: peptidoglycan-binding domain-containing protein, partial [Conexibacter sp.]
MLALVALLMLAVPASASAGELLKRGSRGQDVAQLQRRLHVSADGVFGPQTVAAVRRFQAHHGLVVDGIVGPQTAAALGLDRARGGRAGHAAGAMIPEVLRRIAACESGGNPRA